MSSFYDDASLVVIPSGYKTSKVYAEKPTDGSGDLAFTRTGDTATRVNSAGLIEKVRTNLALNSEGNVSTYNTAINVTNAATSFSSFANAIQIPSTGTSVAYKSVVTTAQPYSISVYIKMDDNSVPVLSSSTTSGNVSLIIAGSFATDNLKVESVGNNVYRLSGSAIGSGASNNNGVVRYDTQTLKSFKIAGIQLTVGDVATDYIKTTTAAVSVGPVANVPRLDYLGSTCGKLLLEPQRTNLAKFSEQFDNAAWVKSAGGTGIVPVVTANNATSPDGYQNADTIVFNSGAGTSSSDQSIVYQALGSLSAGTYTGSFYAKTASGTAQIMMRHAGAVGYTKFTITDQWQRFTSTEVKGVTSTAFLEIGIRRGGNEPINASATIQLWGIQLEQGAYSTSLIPTLAASATRGAEKVAKTGITSLIGQTEGTIYFEINKTARTDSEYRFNLSDGSSDNWIFLGIEASNVPRFYVRAAASTGVDFSGSALSSGTHKVAAAYKQNDFVLYVDGMQVGSDTSGNVGATSQLHFGGNYIDQAAETDSRTAQALLFKTRLSNASLAELTTL